MTQKMEMPEPVTYAHITDAGFIRMWSREKTNLRAVTESIGREPVALITTDQAEAYKDACVREALDLAYQSAREVEKNLLADHLQHVSGPAAVSYVANRIRALITIMTTNRRAK